MSSDEAQARADVGETLATMLRTRALSSPDDVAYTFLADGADDARSLTWSELDRRAQVLASQLHARGAAGHTVLLALPSGLAFIESLFACWYANAVAVPVSVPRHKRIKHRLDAILHDSRARFAFGTATTRENLGGSLGKVADELHWIDPAGVESSGRFVPTEPDASSSRRIALLQYTSGSTGSPRGVVVTHSNLLHNSRTISAACATYPADVIGGWLPLFHDMGLIGLVVQAATSGARCVFMSPERFLMRPWLWLRMISKYRVVRSPAPNFAYELCAEKVPAEQRAGLDLSSWKIALSGSEPVRVETMDRFSKAFASCGFSREAFFPCYGLAEATLFVTGPGPRRGIVRRSIDGSLVADTERGGYVGCGTPHSDTRIAIVDPVTRIELPSPGIGEIWVRGNSVAAGYWQQPQVTREIFGARIAAAGSRETAPADRDDAWLRTGDLGFLADDELFITGRLREMIIISGRNHFPADIEQSIEAVHPAIAASGAVAFAVDVDGLERLVVAAEIRREYAGFGSVAAAQTLDAEDVRRRIRAAVSADHEVSPYDVVLLRPGGLPRTSSGKVRRLAARDTYLNHTLETLESPTHVVSTS